MKDCIKCGFQWSEGTLPPRTCPKDPKGYHLGFIPLKYRDTNKFYRRSG